MSNRQVKEKDITTQCTFQQRTTTINNPTGRLLEEDLERKMEKVAHQSFDIIIIGAGIAGINAAYRIQAEIPEYRYTILEARNSTGGTWDVFRYPGIRSDSELFTYGFEWYPWNKQKPIAEGSLILEYLHEAVSVSGIDKHILFGQKVMTASWYNGQQTWKLNVKHTSGEEKLYTSRFLIFATGYYDYDQPLPTQIPGLENFKGVVVHPQFWPEDLDYGEKKVIVIGSGATAITMIPKLSERASKLVMLQRSPSYILSLPNSTFGLFSPWLPKSVSRTVTRIMWMAFTQIFFVLSRLFPNVSKRVLKGLARRELPGDIQCEPHFSPKYKPWDQRVCFCPDSDFYQSLHSSNTDVKTGTIKLVKEDGIEIDSGEVLDADIIITATGLKMQIAGGIKFQIDEACFDISKKYMWNGLMLQDLPNAFFILGYVHTSWTLGADATARFICRLLRYLEQNEESAAVPRLGNDVELQPRRIFDLNSTYIRAAQDYLPKAGDKWPWLPRHSYFSDYMFARWGKIENCCLELVK
jgi:cation diffusion facilitator CzcD-associated flavoprotein CzcO